MACLTLVRTRSTTSSACLSQNQNLENELKQKSSNDEVGVFKKLFFSFDGLPLRITPSGVSAWESVAVSHACQGAVTFGLGLKRKAFLHQNARPHRMSILDSPASFHARARQKTKHNAGVGWWPAEGLLPFVPNQSGVNFLDQFWLYPVLDVLDDDGNGRQAHSVGETGGV